MRGGTIILVLRTLRSAFMELHFFALEKLIEQFLVHAVERGVGLKICLITSIVFYFGKMRSTRSRNYSSERFASREKKEVLFGGHRVHPLSCCSVVSAQMFFTQHDCVVCKV